MADFKSTIDSAFAFQGDSILIGTAMLNKEAVVNTHVKWPLNMVSRHGLIAGATGTGKTKTIQHLAESLSEKGEMLAQFLKGMKQIPVALDNSALVISDNGDMYGTYRNCQERGMNS